MAELVDALASGASVRKDVEVQVLFWAPSLSWENLRERGRVGAQALCQLESLVFAQVAELVDALASGASIRKDVEVQVLSWAPPLSNEHVASCRLQHLQSEMKESKKPRNDRGFFVPTKY